MTNPLEQTLAPLLTQLFEPSILLSGLLSGPRARLPESVLKVEITPVLLRGRPQYQFAYHQARKVTHRNLIGVTAQAEILALLSAQFKQAAFHTAQGDVHVTLNKRFEAVVRDGRGEGGEGGEGERGRRKDREQRPPPNKQRTTHNKQQPAAKPSLLLPLPPSPPLPFLTTGPRTTCCRRDSPCRFWSVWA